MFHNQLKHFYNCGFTNFIVSLILSFCRPTFSIILLNKEPTGYNLLPTSAVPKWIKVVFLQFISEFSGLINLKIQKREH